MTEGFFNSLLLKIGPWSLALLLRIWFLTCRIREHNPERLATHTVDKKVIVASFWHYSIVFLIYFMRNYPVTAMVSASRDGEYIAKLASYFNFDTVRGSRNTDGVKALKGMLRAVKNMSNAAIVADGSQGPPKVAQPGSILISSRTGAPIIPIVWSGSNYLTFNSWDRTAVPKPFSRIDIYYGEPIEVPAKIDENDIERYRALLEESLNTLYKTAWQEYGKTQH